MSGPQSESSSSNTSPISVGRDLDMDVSYIMPSGSDSDDTVTEPTVIFVNKQSASADDGTQQAPTDALAPAKQTDCEYILSLLSDSDMSIEACEGSPLNDTRFLSEDDEAPAETQLSNSDLAPEENYMMPHIRSLYVKKNAPKDLQDNPLIKRFRTKATPSNGLRIQCEDIESYNAARSTLEEDGTHLYTHQLPSQKGLRIVVKNIHHSTPCEWIKNILSEKGYVVRHIRCARQRFTGKPLNLFEVEIQPTADGSHLNILSLKELSNQAVRIERQAKPVDPPQCHRCQAYGHTKNYCRRPFKCMKCAGDHASTDCTKQRNTTPKCTNCGGEHISSYKGCPSLKAARSKLSSVRAIAEVKRMKQKRLTDEMPLDGQRKAVDVASSLPQHPGQSPALSYSRVVRSGLDVHSSQQKQHQQQQRNKTTKAAVSPSDNDMQNTASPANPFKASHISLRPQPVLGKPQHKRPAGAKATKKAKINSQLPKVEASGVINRGPSSNPAEKHLACFQNRLREEQQRNQQQPPQPDYLTMFNKLENKIDQLINVMMRFIEHQAASSTLPAQPHQQQELLQQASRQRNASSIASMELDTANDMPNDD
ncbi:uncharacterized protein LOC122757071 [Drosophila mojavensis]|uniref:uncharacterized protein LOC122757071 n=1 Tax=Drosophila mojavensis TaxID=7230 RepID=UPI001CD17246|nr:uncharacterized protein LOC122757071 [Drosophila mojavensis]